MMQERRRPLPESITRFLAEPMAGIGEDHLGDRGRPARRASRRPSAALKIAVTWAIAYNVAGAAILYWLWSTMGVAAP